MDRDDPEAMVDPAGGALPRRRLSVAALLLAAFLVVATLWWWRGVADDAAAEPSSTRDPVPRRLADIFPKWDKPDLVLLLSAQQHGYLQPCGCSKPQYGGLTRRYNFLQILKDGGWPVVAMDLGDIPQRSGLQTMLKYTKSMKALDLMGYAAVGIGEYEMGLPLFKGLGNYTLNNKTPPVLAANLRNRDKGEVFHGLGVGSWRVTAGKGQPRVGIIAAVGQSLQDLAKQQIKDPDLAFDRLPRVLPQVLREIQGQKPEFLVLLYQGSVAEAKVLAQAIPNFQVIVCLAHEEEPPSIPDQVGNTSIITLGHKGRYVGVVGAYRTGKKERPFTVRYQLVGLGEEFDTPRSKIKGHPVMDLMEDYAKEVKRNDFLGKAAVRKVGHPINLEFPKATYAGSQKCKKCHENAYAIWWNSPHRRAYETLVVRARHPSLRQYDSECIKCHVTGWEYKGGFMDEVKTKHLKDNGCENCHGPCSEHIQLEIDNKAARFRMRQLINPNRFDPDEKPADRVKRLNRIDMACQKCHDIDNDVSWKLSKWFDRKIVHSGDVDKP